jgi:hypothetical protein
MTGTADDLQATLFNNYSIPNQSLESLLRLTLIVKPALKQ